MNKLNQQSNSLIFSVVTTDYHALKNKSHRENQKKLVKQLKVDGFSVTLQLNVQQHCVVIDSKIVWYGNIDVLGRNKAESSFIRLESPLISKEIKEILKLKS
ncbi:MAG: hypothetical protein KC455_05720 [Carnobacterium sp.]|nr:hypothetical protein [Carnobacterium sp.]